LDKAGLVASDIENSYVFAAERMVRDPPIGTRAGFGRRFLTYLIDIIRAIRSGWSLNQGGLEHDGRLANLHA
jgi:hypothetical protein